MMANGIESGLFVVGYTSKGSASLTNGRTMFPASRDWR